MLKCRLVSDELVVYKYRERSEIVFEIRSVFLVSLRGIAVMMLTLH